MKTRINSLVWIATAAISLAASLIHAAETPPNYRIKELDYLQINCTGALHDQPIVGTYEVEPEAMLLLGLHMAGLKVSGLTLEEATETITKQVGRILKQPQVSITIAAPPGKMPADLEEALSGAAGGKKYLLQYKFHAGEAIRSQIEHVATIQTTISGSTQTTDMSSRSIKVWRITGVDPEGKITFEHLVESVDMRNQMLGRQEVHYNSLTDKTAPLGYEDVAKSLGKVLSTVTIDPFGGVVHRDEKQSRAVADASGSVLVVPLPKEPVPIGHAWTLPADVKVPLDDGETKVIETRQRFELEKVEKGIATIGVETQVLTPVTNPKIQVQLVQRMSKGHIRFDIAAGRILSQRTDLDERVLGFSGQESSLHYVARFTEEPVPADTKTASSK